jgi:hypothetical protein
VFEIVAAAAASDVATSEASTTVDSFSFDAQFFDVATVSMLRAKEQS